MLKKAGIVVAASAAALLAMSPLAFADGGIDKDSEGLVSGLNGNNAQVPAQVCNNNVPVNVLGVQVPVEDGAIADGVTGGAGILGSGDAESGDSVTDQSDNCGQAAGAGDSVED